MILRRLTQSLREQNWTAIWIEFVLLIAGVFLGIQVSNWNEDRVDNQKAAVFTARLKADMRVEDWNYRYLVAYNREVLANANQAADALEGDSEMSDEAFLISAYRATQYKDTARRRSSYDELVSTGTIGLIRDQTLRDTAMRLYSVTIFTNLVREGKESRYREAFRMSLPNAVQRALMKKCGDHYVEPGDNAGIHNVIDYPCSTGLSAQIIAESVISLRSNPKLLPSLRLRIADLETRLGDMTRNNRTLMKSLHTIAMEKP
jgi:hypothetical protein